MKIIYVDVVHLPETDEHERADRYSVTLEDGTMLTLYHGYDENPNDLEWVALPPVPGTEAAQKQDEDDQAA